MEIDLYGGFRGNIGASDFTFDVGAIQYYYPGEKYNTVTATTAVDADTTEIYGGLGWKWFGVKYSYYLSDEVFGFANADGSYYLALTGSLPVGETGLTLGASWGTFTFENNDNQDYEDWSVSAAYNMGKLSPVTEGVTVGLKYTDTNADKAFWTDANGEFLGDDAFTVWISKAL